MALLQLSDSALSPSSSAVDTALQAISTGSPAQLRSPTALRYRSHVGPKDLAHSESNVRLSALHKIIYHILWIHLFGLSLCTSRALQVLKLRRSNTNLRLFRQSTKDPVERAIFELQAVSSTLVRKLVSLLPLTVEQKTEKSVMRFVQACNVDKTVTNILDQRFTKYYHIILQHYSDTYMACSNSKRRTDHYQRLSNFMKAIHDLRKSIAQAADSGHLSRDLLTALRTKFKPFDQQTSSLYLDCCHATSDTFPLERSFVSMNAERWWESPLKKKEAEKLLEKAENHKNEMRWSLTFIVPIITALSIIPAAMAWKHAEPEPGTSSDSNFFQAISSSSMQLLGLLTFIWPTILSPRLSRKSWMWVWIVAAFSGACAIVSIPLYVFCSAIWSFAVSFAGVVAQAVVQLQVINAI